MNTSHSQTAHTSTRMPPGPGTTTMEMDKVSTKGNSLFSMNLNMLGF